MPDPAQPTADAHSQGKPPIHVQDDAQVSGKVKPPKTQSRPPKKMPEQKNYEALKKAREDAEKVEAEGLRKWKVAQCKLTFQAGLKVVHAIFLRANSDSRQTTFSAFMDVAQPEEMQTLVDYLNALNTLLPPPESTPKELATK